MAFSMMGGGEGWNGKYTPVEYFDTLRECKAAAKRYIDGAAKRYIDGYAYRHFRCVPEGVSVDAIGDEWGISALFPQLGHAE